MTEKVELPPQKPLQRIITVICDTLPDFGRIRKHQFTTTFGAGMTFEKSENTSWPGYYLTVNQSSPVWTSQELRELAAECVVLADHLDKQKG